MPAGRRREGEAGFLRQVHGSASEQELERAAASASRVVDALGTFCPEPLIRTQDAARDMVSGETLLLLADDAGVELDIPAWCMSHRHEYLGLLKEPRRYRVLVRIR